jgi:signal transduction histidine kinase
MTIFTLVIFLISILSLTFYVSRALRGDMQRLLGEHQFSTVSFLADEVNQALDERLRLLEALAGIASPAVVRSTAALRAFLEQRPRLQSLFNGGVMFLDLDGTAIADASFSEGRTGVNFMDHDGVAAALKEGQSTIGKPHVAKGKKFPEFIMAVPIRDTQGKVIGALSGLTDLGKPNFLDKITESRYGTTGGYLLVAPQYRLVVTASDKSRTMEALPASGINPMIDRFVQGYEGSAVLVNPLGMEVLASAKGIPVVGWYASVVLPTAEAFAPIYALQQRMRLATIFFTLLASGLTWWMLRRQLAPMLGAAKTLATLSGTKQSWQSLPIDRQDEIGELVGGFNRLLETLKQRETALQESEALKQAILNSVVDEIAVLDHTGMIVMLNQRWRRFNRENGFESGQLVAGVNVGANYFAVCQAAVVSASDGAQEALDGIRAVSAGRLPGFSQEYPCHSPKHERWLSMSVTPLDGALKGGVVIALADITERKRVEADRRELTERLTVTNRALEQASRMKMDLMANVTHELRTPLNSIIGFAELLKDEIPGPLNPKQAQFAADILESGQRLLAVVDRILEMSRLDTAGAALEREPVDIGAAIEERVVAHRKAVEARGLTVRTDVAQEVGSVDLAPQSLRRMLDALLDNAIKFNSEGGTFSVSARRAGGALEIAVADTGIGIAREDLAKLFKPLAQLDAGLARRHSGIGMGLALAQRLAELHGGTIEVDSEPGKGSTFTLRLPMEKHS